MKNDSISSEMLLENDRIEIHPAYNASDENTIPLVWIQADRIRFLLYPENSPKTTTGKGEDEYALRSAIVRQVKTVSLYRIMVATVSLALKDRFPEDEWSLYILLFPGSTKDNTGLKDLNDNILGYEGTNDFLRIRNEKIRDIFEPDDPGLKAEEKFRVLGIDYKTATFLSFKMGREDFVGSLRRLELALKKTLLKELLPDAERKAKDLSDKARKVRLRNIQTLKRVLRKNEYYRFDVFFGLVTFRPDTLDLNPIDLTFLLMTEALKGSAVSRIISKGSTNKRSVAKKYTKKIKPDAKILDPRGKKYDWDTFMAAFEIASDIKTLMTKTERRYYHILVDKVWTGAFLQHKRNFKGNPDVIRDVRKKRLKPARLRDINSQPYFRTQKELLELWLIVLNMVDFVMQQFLHHEFETKVVEQHDQALAALIELQKKSKDRVDLRRLRRVLTQDVVGRQKAVLGTASEFLFYSYAADYEERIFFSMDIRDLGVELVLFYEYSNERTLLEDYSGLDLMRETFRANQPIIMQKRLAYNEVWKVFLEYYERIPKELHLARRSAVAVFDNEIDVTETMPAFPLAVQIMLGGDEIFVAVHPYFEKYVTEIVEKLDLTQNMRMAVTYSKADKKKGSASQRSANQKVHNEAITLADAAPETLKSLERTHRRIARLIHLVKLNEKNSNKEQAFTDRLNALGLTKLYARAKYRQQKILGAVKYTQLLRHLRNGDAIKASEDKNFEFVNFEGKVLSIRRLEVKAERLEKEIVTVVGSDNKHFEPIIPDKDPGKMYEKIDEFIDKIWQPPTA